MTANDRRPSARARNNLVALGTAAVLAVYAAGFDRTRAAAQKFAEADAAQRRPAPPSARLGDTLISSPAPRTVDSAVAMKKTVPPAKKDSTRTTPTVASIAQAADTAAHPTEKAAQPVTPVPVVDSAAKTDSSAQSDKERGPYKDGVYYGWGTSRHGDIQAGVEISNGRISAAWIEQCLTRYSCSWIAALPPQVEKRQSAEVDFVSGATQSTNAFYTGVVQALNRAK